MEKLFTFNDLQFYYREISSLRVNERKDGLTRQEPSRRAMRNILGYSGALKVLKTKSAGVFVQLAN